MGAVDLVLQVESPKSVARGLQRIGRAGHSVGDTSKGRIFPKFRADLLECAVVVKLMREGRIEPTVVPHNALDVLAQQIVAIAASAEPEPVSVDELFALVTRTHSYAELSRDLLENVLDMLDGRYPSREFGELRPRIVWDRVGGTIRARKGARQLAVTNAGTIPDRGLFSVVLPDGRRVGELDEEMVYEARAGPDLPARRLDVAHRGDRARPRHRHARRPASRAPCPSGRATASGARRSSAARSAPSAAGRSTSPPRCSSATTTSTRWPRATSSTTCASSRTPRAWCRATARSSSSASATRSATGGCASCRPYGGRVHAAWGLALSRAHPRGVRPRVRRDLVRRRDHRPPARRRRAAGRRPRARRPRRARGRRRRRARHERAVRRALPRERRALAAHPARLPRQAHAAVAAAAEVAVAARGRAALRAVPDRARDLPRVPARRARPARADRAAARAAPPRAQRGRGRDADRLAVRLDRCSSTTSPRTCTRATRRTPSAARRRCRWTASCCASCSARRSCASSSTPARWSRSSSISSTAPTARARTRATRWPTSCAASAT